MTSQLCILLLPPFLVYEFKFPQASAAQSAARLRTFGFLGWDFFFFKKGEGGDEEGRNGDISLCHTTEQDPFSHLNENGGKQTRKML